MWIHIEIDAEVLWLYLMSLESVLLKAQVFDDTLAVLFKIDEGLWNLFCLCLDNGVGSTFAAAYLMRNNSILRFKELAKNAVFQVLLTI